MPYMLSAHMAPALIAKAARPGINLFVGIVLCFLPDILHSICILFGIERFRVDERYSHTLLAMLLISITVFIISRFLDVPTIDSLIYAGIVISHFLFDMVNRRKMAITPWGPEIRGLGLHGMESAGGRLLSFIVELSILLISIGIFAWARYDGDIASLRLPALLLSIMLILEAFYFRIYFPDVKGILRSWRS